MNNELYECCWACGQNMNKSYIYCLDRRYGPICDACRHRLLRVWSRGIHDDFTCDGLNKGHMWYMRHPCSVGFAPSERIWCWCGREIAQPGITPRWEVELNEILQRLGVV